MGTRRRFLDRSVSLLPAVVATSLLIAGCCLATPPTCAQSSDDVAARAGSASENAPLVTPGVTGVVELEECEGDCDLGDKTFIDAPLMVTTTPSPVSVSEPGGNVTFTVRVQNRSTVEPANLIELMDDIYGDVTDPGNPALIPPVNCSLPPPLDPDDALPGGTDEYNCSFQVFVSGFAGQVKTNTVTATLSYVAGLSTPEGAASVAVLGPTPTAVEPAAGRPPLEFGPPALRNQPGPGGSTIASPVSPLSPTGPALSPPYEEVQLLNVNDSGTDVTFEGGVDLRVYDLRRFSFDPAVRGQALIDFDWNLETVNTLGTIIKFDPPFTPIRSVCVAAGDFGSDDDGMLRLADLSPGPSPETDEAAWPATATWPFATLKVESTQPGGITEVLFTSGLNFPDPDSDYPNSAFIEDISFVPVDVFGPPGVPDGKVGKPMIVGKADPSGTNLDVSWDTMACCQEADLYHLLYGSDLNLPPQTPFYDVQGSECFLNPPLDRRMSTYTWSSPAAPAADCSLDLAPCALDGDCAPQTCIGVFCSLDGQPCAVDEDCALHRCRTHYLWWTVVGSQGAFEGSWGKDSSGAERSGPAACQSKTLTNPCGHLP